LAGVHGDLVCRKETGASFATALLVVQSEVHSQQQESDEDVADQTLRHVPQPEDLNPTHQEMMVPAAHPRQVALLLKNTSLNDCFDTALKIVGINTCASVDSSAQSGVPVSTLDSQIVQVERSHNNVKSREEMMMSSK
jgi:hypothetical protein